MEAKNEIKEYSNGEITIVWDASKCKHVGNCVRHLPKVYDPKAKPWIKIENAGTEAIKDQIATCPSGALSWK
ncbi:MAG: (4Fe-4S)-binding protein [Crocinitomicaceae bacterium]